MAGKISRSKRFQQVEIGEIEGRRCVVEAAENDMSAFGGAPMIAAVERSVRLVSEICNRIKDGRAQDRVKHSAFDITLQRVCQIATGNPDGNDADWLRYDRAIVSALNQHDRCISVGASQETISKFETKAIDKDNLESIKSVFIDHFIVQHRSRKTRWQQYWRMGQRKRITLDIDGSMFKTYGTQEGSVYRGGKYSHEMYYPSFVFAGKWLLAASLRKGTAGESTTVVDQLEMIVPKLRKQWPGVRICVRLDAAFGSGKLYKWCREHHVNYQVGLKETSVLAKHAKSFKDQAEREFRETFGEPEFLGKNGNKKAQADHERIRLIEDPKERMKAEQARRSRFKRVIGEFSYRAEEWAYWERIIVRVDYTDKGFDVRYVLVDWQTGPASSVYHEEYCGRGSMEQFIGQFKQTGQKLSAQSFNANQFRLILHGVTYQLLVHLREIVGGALAKAEVQTLKKILMVMPIVVRKTATKLVLQVSENHPHTRLYLAAWRKLSA